MEKALRCCRFGKDPYAWLGPFDEPQADSYRFSDKALAPGIEVNLADLSPELKELMRLLFSFKMKVKVYNAVEPPIPGLSRKLPLDGLSLNGEALQPGDVVVEGHFSFHRFLPLSTDLQWDIQLDNGVTSRKLEKKDVMLVEQRNGDLLTGLRILARAKANEVKGGVTVRAHVDVDGKGHFFVPKDGNMEEKTWDPSGALGTGLFGDDFDRMPTSEWQRLWDLAEQRQWREYHGLKPDADARFTPPEDELTLLEVVNRFNKVADEVH